MGALYNRRPLILDSAWPENKFPRRNRHYRIVVIKQWCLYDQKGVEKYEFRQQEIGKVHVDTIVDAVIAIP